ncbi:hypothetical protein Syun_007119 [Stephania yunnanensis]|uniref:Uncharacterized protein n=1 Tax=Stephania yunnanensis TaxID=152371 RepID=A0AAP0PYC0_9MAGN
MTHLLGRLSKYNGLGHRWPETVASVEIRFGDEDKKRTLPIHHRQQHNITTTLAPFRQATFAKPSENRNPNKEPNENHNEQTRGNSRETEIDIEIANSEPPNRKGIEIHCQNEMVSKPS